MKLINKIKELFKKLLTPSNESTYSISMTLIQKLFSECVDQLRTENPTLFNEDVILYLEEESYDSAIEAIYAKVVVYNKNYKAHKGGVDISLYYHGDCEYTCYIGSNAECDFVEEYDSILRDLKRCINFEITKYNKLHTMLNPKTI